MICTFNSHCQYSHQGPEHIVFTCQPMRLGFLTKLFSGFSRNTKLAKMRPCFTKRSRVSQDQIFAIFMFRESYNFRETHEIRLIKNYGSCQGFLKIRRNRELTVYLQLSQHTESLLFYKMFIIHVEVCAHIHKYISHYCFAKCILSTPLDYCDLFCIRNNCNYSLCKICSNKSKKVVTIAIITSNRKRESYFAKN
jgi:hypothetical protein